MTTELTSPDGTHLYLTSWPVADAKATVLLLHGYAEHGERYRHVAEAWNAQGIQVFAPDLRGHGRSEGRRGFVERFADYHQDVDVALAHVKSKAGGGPVFLFGHSMGGLLAAHWLLARGRAGLAGCVLSSPYLGLALKVNPVKSGLGKLMSKVAPGVSLPSGLSGKDVTRDPEMARRYDEDPLNVKTANARWFTEATAAMEVVHVQAGRIELPLFLLYGGDDRVASAADTDRFAAAIKKNGHFAERLPGYFHELVNEPPAERNAVIARMAKWMLERSGAVTA